MAIEPVAPPPQPRKRLSRPPERVLQRRRAALVSAAYHAHRDSMSRLAKAPAFLRPMRMDDAVEQLIEDAHMPSMVQGLSWMFDNPAPSGDVKKHRSALQRALDPDDLTREEDIEAELVRLRPSILLGFKPDQPIKGGDIRALRQLGEALGDDEPAPAQSRFAMVYQLLSGKLSACKRSNFVCNIRFDPDTFVTSVEAQVEVERSASEFKVLADPCGWTELSPLFWQRSDLGRYTGGDSFINDSPQPDPGTVVYENRDLFEAINLSWNPFFPLQGNNVLRATHKHLDPLPPNPCVTAHMDVSLGVSLSTTIGTSQSRGGLDVDGGTVEVTQLSAAPARTRLRATKRARFTERDLCGVRLGPWLNLFAPFFLGPWIAALVYEGACFETDI